jgi:hypothetical protein
MCEVVDFDMYFETEGVINMHQEKNNKLLVQFIQSLFSVLILLNYHLFVLY